MDTGRHACNYTIAEKTARTLRDILFLFEPIEAAATRLSVDITLYMQCRARVDIFPFCFQSGTREIKRVIQQNPAETEITVIFNRILP